MSGRFQILRSPLIIPAFTIFGATRAKSYVELIQDGLHVRFGFLFNHSLDLSVMGSVEHSQWPWYLGLGCRIGTGGRFAVVGSTKNVVRIAFKEPQEIPALFSWKYKTQFFYLSLEQPDEFIQVLTRRITRAGISQG